MTPFEEHMSTGTTSVATCWEIRRRDGAVLGFTDHDADLAFGGCVFRAGTGLTARSLDRTTGLAVDNAEAVGALSDDAVTEADIAAGRYDGAEVIAYRVNWAAPEMREVLFRGSIGEIRRSGGAFEAELRGLSEALNQPVGRVYQGVCPAMLGDADCGVDLSDPALSVEATVADVAGDPVLDLLMPAGFAQRWFERGRLEVLDGDAAGLVGWVKVDRATATGRRVDLWQRLGAGLAAGDRVQLEAGCDKRIATCREKFGNVVNFRGFPDIPGEDWIMVHPSRAGIADGGSRRG